MCVCVCLCVSEKAATERTGARFIIVCLLVSYLLLLVVVLYGFFVSLMFSFFLSFFCFRECMWTCLLLSISQSIMLRNNTPRDRTQDMLLLLQELGVTRLSVCVCVCVRIPQQYVRSIKFFAAMVPHSRNCGKRTRTSPGAAHCKKKKELNAL